MCAGVKDVRLCKCVGVNSVVVSATETPPANQHAVSWYGFAVVVVFDFIIKLLTILSLIQYDACLEATNKMAEEETNTNKTR